jgi:hypothetical protein
MNKQKSAKKWTDAIQTVFVDCSSSPRKRCFEVKCLGEIGEVAPEVADIAMREESFADVSIFWNEVSSMSKTPSTTSLWSAALSTFPQGLTFTSLPVICGRRGAERGVAGVFL